MALPEWVKSQMAHDIQLKAAKKVAAKDRSRGVRAIARFLYHQALVDGKRIGLKEAKDRADVWMTVIEVIEN